ncbi:MAG TPA: O-antigen ligase family protein [Candidatus Polarisedimenticolaceae bacterium]|nr:O-antigen ligase family protein [Candidatus Polarisedimenticolaceae bacterium]
MSAGSAPGALLALTAALLVVLPLFPPEIQGVSAAGIATLLALGAALALGTRHLLPILLLAVAAWPLSIASLAPGATPGAIALPLLALAAAAIGSRADARTRALVAPVLAAAGAVLALHALWQVTFGLERAARALTLGMGTDPAAPLAVARLREGRAFATFATPAALGCFFALSLPVTLFAAASARGRTRLLLGASAALQAAGLAATQSATAVGALAAAGALAALRRPGLRRILLPALLALAALLAGILVVRRDRLLEPGAAQGSWHLRAGNAAAASRMIAAHPWLGVGPGAFAEAYPSVLRPGGNEVRHAHMLPLELMAELGVPLGLLASAAFAAAFLGPLLRGRGEGIALGCAAFAIQNLADFTAFFPSLLWLAALLRGTLSEEERAAELSPALVLGRAAVLAAALVAAGAGLSADARRDAAALLAAGQTEDAVRVAARAGSFAPWEADAHLLAGAAQFRAGALGPALRETERALALAPVRPAAYAQRARIRATLGDHPGACADLTRAAALYPASSAYAREAEAARRRLARAYGEGG